MSKRKVKDMSRNQQKAVMATLKPQKISIQRKIIKKPYRTPLKKPTKHRVELKEGKITPMTKKGDALITNYYNIKIDKYAET